MKVNLVAATTFYDGTAEQLTGWTTDTNGGQALAEFAGRACYSSWKKPNPATATNAGYLAHILESGHLSVLEHGSATFYITGISRSLSHEFVRHRHFSYSQLSQRYVPGIGETVPPPDAVTDLVAERIFQQAMESAEIYYEQLKDHFEQRFAGIKDRTLRNKKSRQAARSVLPNATETKIVVTGNHRAWRHFIGKRASEHADVEIRALAIEILRDLQLLAGNVFNDFKISTLEDGTEVATSPHLEVS